MKLKSSWNLAGWNLLNIINLRKRGEIQPKKNIDVQTKFGFSEKSSTCCGRGLFSHGSFPAHGRSSWKLPGLFNDPKMAQKASKVAAHFKVDGEIAVVFFCLKKSLVEEIQHIQHSRRWFATHLKHMSNHKSTWRW